jgi:hypothetical protein
MLLDFDNYRRKNFDKLKERGRKGIPDSVRSIVWQKYANIKKYRDSFIGLYDELANDEEIDVDIESVILRDIDRTFPKHSFFKDKYGLGQRALFNVLRAYSKFNEVTGYVQGMGFIAALMLTYMDEESTFWMIHCLMVDYNLKGYYLKGFPELNRSYYKLLSLMKKHIPKIYEHFRKEGVLPTMYACQWFISLYSVVFSFDILVRIFDIFLLEGDKILYRMALAIFKYNEERLLKAKSFDAIMGMMRSLYENIKVDEIMSYAYKFSIAKSHLIEFDKMYDKVKNDLNDEIMKQILF